MKMKTATAMVTSLCLAASLSGPFFAATTDVGTTDSTVKFITDSSIEKLLRLEKVPAFDFGEKEISSSDKNYDVDLSSNNTKMDLVVADERGTGTGYTVTAELKTQFKSTTSESELTGANIKIAGGTVVYGATSSNTPAAPVHNSSSVTMDPEVEVKILDADGELLQGMGIWKDTMNGVSLYVPGGVALTQNYKTTVVWNLNDTPND